MANRVSAHRRARQAGVIHRVRRRKVHRDGITTRCRRRRRRTIVFHVAHRARRPASHRHRHRLRGAVVSHVRAQRQRRRRRRLANRDAIGLGITAAGGIRGRHHHAARCPHCARSSGNHTTASIDAQTARQARRGITRCARRADGHAVTGGVVGA